MNKEKKLFIVFLLILLLIASAMALIISFRTDDNPERSVNEYLTALKELNEEEMGKYIAPVVLDNEIDVDGLNNPMFLTEDEELMAELIKDISWDIKSHTINEDFAEVEVETTATDLGSFISNMFNKVWEVTLSSEFWESDVNEKNDKAINDYMLDKIKEKDYEKKTSNVIFQLIKDEETGNWLIINQEVLIKVYGLDFN